MNWPRFWFIVGCILAAGWLALGVYQVIDQGNKQDECIKAGGAWIDNRYTEAYCFFNK